MNLGRIHKEICSISNLNLNHKTKYLYVNTYVLLYYRQIVIDKLLFYYRQIFENKFEAIFYYFGTHNYLKKLCLCNSMLVHLMLFKNDYYKTRKFLGFALSLRSVL